LKTEEQRLQATQARDSYVKEVEAKLEAIEKDIDQMEQQASNAEGADKDSINTRIEALQAQHDRAQEALDDLKNADLASWENHKQHVSTAMQGLDSNLVR
jgi:chaperonin cofactor prefoldin